MGLRPQLNTTNNLGQTTNNCSFLFSINIENKKIKEKLNMAKTIDLTGQKFNHWTVIKRFENNHRG